jgi:hypothetical protein
MKGYTGFMTLDAMIVVCGSIWLLSVMIFFHASYMQLMRHALLRIEAIEYAQQVLGYARNGDAVPSNLIPDSWDYKISELPGVADKRIRWIVVTVVRENITYSLMSVCI